MASRRKTDEIHDLNNARKYGFIVPTSASMYDMYVALFKLDSQMCFR